MNKKKLSRREFLKIGLWTLFGGSTSSLGGYYYASTVEPKWIDITEVEISLAGLPKEFSGFKITQISDIHFGSWMTELQFSKIIDLVNKTDPDLIAITGDFVSNSPKIFKPILIKELSRLKSKHDKYAVLGNHDHWTDPVIIREALSASNIIELNNAIDVIKKGNDHLYICGVDDHWEKLDRIEKVTENLPTDACAILLAHEPDFAVISAATRRFDLQISGHSHGGQVVIPFLGAPILPKYAKKYPQGHYQIEDMQLYTNRGVGMNQPAVRFNCRPEITVFTLRKT